MEKIAKALPIVKEIEVGGEIVKVQKLPLGEYAKLLIALKKMPGSVLRDLQNVNTEDNDAMISTLFGVFAEAWGQVIEIVAIGSGIDKDRLENDPAIGLDGGIELFLAIWEVNNLNQVFKSVKNALSRAQ